jgi:peptidoglycan hydrolase-like protein with peptidoglycan-binding domain
MTRALFLTVLAAIACTNKAATYSGDTTGATSAGAATRGAVAPSDLSAEQIRLVQRSLIDRGFAVDPTGAFDDRTRAALMDFQRARGLPANASLDQPTLDALGLDPRAVTPARGSTDPTGRTAAPSEGPTPEVRQ